MPLSPLGAKSGKAKGLKHWCDASCFGKRALPAEYDTVKGEGTRADMPKGAAIYTCVKAPVLVIMLKLRYLLKPCESSSMPTFTSSTRRSRHPQTFDPGCPPIREHVTQARVLPLVTSPHPLCFLVFSGDALSAYPRHLSKFYRCAAAHRSHVRVFFSLHAHVRDERTVDNVPTNVCIHVDDPLHDTQIVGWPTGRAITFLSFVQQGLLMASHQSVVVRLSRKTRGCPPSLFARSFMVPPIIRQ